MVIQSRNYLRSLANEAARQGEFYSSRNQPFLSGMWFDIEALVTEAMARNHELVLITREVQSTPLPIKSGE